MNDIKGKSSTKNKDYKGISISKVIGNNAITQEKLSNNLIKFHALKLTFNFIISDIIFVFRDFCI